MQLTGAQALIKSLEMEGVEVMFGLPGGCILPAYDPLLDSSIRHILVRHEQGAGHMAEGYAHVTGRPGVAMVTSGPGGHQPRDAAVRRLHGLDPDGGDHRPGADRGDRHRRLPGVRHRRHHPLGHQAQRAGDDAPTTCRVAIREAFHIATTGRPGPVLVDVPKDVLQASMEWYWPDGGRPARATSPTTKGHPAHDPRGGQADPRQPSARCIYAGGGILKARAAEALRELAELTDIHVVTTLMARGAFPDDHPLVPRHAGHARQRHRRHGDAEGRPADRPRRPLRRPRHRQGGGVRPRRQGHPRRHRSGRAGQGAPPRRADRRRLPPGDRGARRERSATCSPAAPCQADTAAWKSRISGWREQFPLTYEPSEPGEALKPQFCLELLRDLAPAGHDPRVGRRPAPDVGVAVLEVRRSPTRG